MNISIHRSIIVVFLISLLSGCGGDGTNGIYLDGDIEELIWDTEGSGDIRFSIERVDNNFEIAVERYEFNPVDVVIILTGSDLEVYGLVEDIFDETVNIYDYTFTPKGPIGTWTAITLIFTGNQELEIEDILRSGELSILYDFVNENTGPAL